MIRLNANPGISNINQNLPLMKLLRLFLVLFSLIVFTFTVHAQSFLTNGLVAYYPFNGNANDGAETETMGQSRVPR